MMTATGIYTAASVMNEKWSKTITARNRRRPIYPPSIDVFEIVAFLSLAAFGHALVRLDGKAVPGRRFMLSML